ncbi:MAG: efflux RND transporter permease subunit [Myxococcaceae bacterium]
MQWLAELCVRRPVFATVLSLVILVVGGVFYTQLGVDQFPKIDFPVVAITTIQPGASPEDMEREVSEKIEGAVNTIAGIDELRSTTSEGVSQVIIQFILEKNVDIASQEVQQKVNSVLAELPRGIDPPVVLKFEPDAQPVLFVALRAEGKSVRDVTDIADRIVRRRLESVSGVGKVVLIGGRKRQVDVMVDPVKLKALGLSPLEVAGAINAQNITLPGGRVDTSRDYYTLRINGRVETVQDLGAIIVRDQAGRSIRLDEIAEVKDGVQDVDSSARWNGERTVLMSISKQSGTNTVAVVDSIRERMKDVSKELPPGYRLEVQRDGSAVVRTGTEAVTEHLILGAIFAAIIVLLFLGNVRSTIIAALAIPTSIIGTFALMKLQGYTLNTITLLALALAVGIVIDDAIVVLENIFKFVEEKGMDPKRAAIEGTREIGTAVLATTLSLIAVFLPIAFVAGIPGRFLGSFGITMSFSIAVSLFVSFTLTPSLAARFLKAKPPGDHTRTLLERVVDVFYRPIERAYVALLAFLMPRRWIVAIVSVLSLLAMGPLASKAKKGFLPIDDRAQFEVVIRLPEGRSVAATELVGERVARIIRARKEVVATLVTVGDDAARSPNLARIYVKLVPPDKRTISQNDYMNLMRQEILPTLPPELKVNIAEVNEFGGGQATAKIQFLVAGPDLRVLADSTPRIIERIKKEVPGAVDVDSTLVLGKPELGVYIDRARAADLGVQVIDVAQALQYLVAGQKVSTYAERGEQYEVRLRATPEYRTSEDALRLITVPSRKLGLVNLADVVQVKTGTSPATILHYQRERQVTFLANAGPGASQGEVGDNIKKIIEEEVPKMGKGFAMKPQGQTKLMRETGLSFIFGLLASFVFMYLILAAQFESWLHPITILISLPLTLPYAIASVILFDQALDLYSFLGIFVLFGVVKKNAILQIDHSNQLREELDPTIEKALEKAFKNDSEADVRGALHDALDAIIGREALEKALLKADWKTQVVELNGRQQTVFNFASIERAVRKAARLKAILKANKDRLRPILMTTFAFVAGMIPLVTAKGIGSGFNRATAGVVVGGQSLSLLLTLVAVPVVYSFFDDISLLFRKAKQPTVGAPVSEEKPAHGDELTAEVSK